MLWTGGSDGGSKWKTAYCTATQLRTTRAIVSREQLSSTKPQWWCVRRSDPFERCLEGSQSYGLWGLGMQLLACSTLESLIRCHAALSGV